MRVCVAFALTSLTEHKKPCSTIWRTVKYVGIYNKKANKSDPTREMQVGVFDRAVSAVSLQILGLFR